VLDIIQGRTQSYSFLENSYQWLGQDTPIKPVKGTAVGGNLVVFRDLLDICNIRPESWEPYILFIEDRDLDLEDYHRILIALDERGIFKHVRALVVGRIDDIGLAGEFKRLNMMFGKNNGYDHHKLTEYLLSDIIKERREKKDPLYILKIDNFGHGVSKNRMILPIGGSTVIHPNKEIQFVGPFVE
jgi:muramoyltetrapeptide carboxypeptidase LdcA involved in peptidoglycan recycling